MLNITKIKNKLGGFDHYKSKISFSFIMKHFYVWWEYVLHFSIYIVSLENFGQNWRYDNPQK